MMNATNIFIPNTVNQTGIRLLGFGILLVFVVIAINSSLFVLLGTLLAFPLLFAKVGYTIDAERRVVKEVLQSIVTITLKEKSIQEITSIAVYDGKFLNELFQIYNWQGKNVHTKASAVVLENKEEEIVFKFPLSHDQEETQRLAIALSRELNVRIRETR